MEVIGVAIILIGFVAILSLGVYHLIGIFQLSREIRQAKDRINKRGNPNVQSLCLESILGSQQVKPLDVLNAEMELYRYFNGMKDSIDPYVSWAASITQLAISDITSVNLGIGELRTNVADVPNWPELQARIWKRSNLWNSPGLRKTFVKLVSNWQEAVLAQDRLLLYEAVTAICWMAFLPEDTNPVDWSKREKLLTQEHIFEMLAICRRSLLQQDSVAAFVTIRPWTRRDQLSKFVPRYTLVPLLHLTRRVIIVVDPTARHYFTPHQLKECYEWVAELTELTTQALIQKDYKAVVDLLVKDQALVYDWFRDTGEIPLRTQEKVLAVA